MNTAPLDAIYVLNVKAFDDRLRSITRQLAALGLAAEVIHAWDIEDISPEVAARWFDAAAQGQATTTTTITTATTTTTTTPPPLTITSAQRSCALKHVEALQRIVANGHRHALVLEDDAMLAPDFLDGVKRALAEAPGYPEASVIYIGSGGNFYTPRSQRELGRSLYPGARGRFTDSYIIGATAAGMRLDWMQTRGIERPIDNQFDMMDRELGIQLLWLEDPVVEQGSKNGRFVTAIDRPLPRWRQGLQFHWEKLRRKWLYQLWR